MAFGAARGLAAKPPEKGVFPLDHFGECKKVGATSRVGSADERGFDGNDGEKEGRRI